jgi:hypothetical protein
LQILQTAGDPVNSAIGRPDNGGGGAVPPKTARRRQANDPAAKRLAHPGGVARVIAMVVGQQHAGRSPGRQCPSATDSSAATRARLYRRWSMKNGGRACRAAVTLEMLTAFNTRISASSSVMIVTSCQFSMSNPSTFAST